MEKFAKTIFHLVSSGAQSCALPAAYLTDGEMGMLRVTGHIGSELWSYHTEQTA